MVHDDANRRSPPSVPRLSTKGFGRLEAAAGKQGLAARSAAGFLLLDSSLRAISFNAEAVRVLGYPDKPANVKSPRVFLADRIRSSLMGERSSPESPLVTEFQSGKRRYLCQTFLVDSHPNGPFLPSLAVVLERSPSGFVPLLQFAGQFNLTRRERDALENLLQGLSSKEIANRMNVSPNTVKAFLRIIMIKMGVSSRSAIVAKLLALRP